MHDNANLITSYFHQKYKFHYLKVLTDSTNRTKLIKPELNIILT